MILEGLLKLGENIFSNASGGKYKPVIDSVKSTADTLSNVKDKFVSDVKSGKLPSYMKELYDNQNRVTYKTDSLKGGADGKNIVDLRIDKPSLKYPSTIGGHAGIDVRKDDGDYERFDFSPKGVKTIISPDALDDAQEYYGQGVKSPTTGTNTNVYRFNVDDSDKRRITDNILQFKQKVGNDYKFDKNNCSDFVKAAIKGTKIDEELKKHYEKKSGISTPIDLNEALKSAGSIEPGKDVSTMGLGDVVKTWKSKRQA